MPTWINVDADSLENFMIEINKRLAWFNSRLDSKNVKRLNTNQTNIKSANGETEIIGPLLVMKDAGGTIRLKQGLNPLTGLFEFTLFNSSGNETVDIDSNGDAQFAGNIIGGTINIGNGVFTVNESGVVSINDGTILITRTDNKARVSINATDGIKLQKGDGTGLVWTDTVYFDVDGNVVIKGIFRSDESPNKRIEIENNQIRTYNSSNEFNGLVTDNSDMQFGDVQFYINNNHAFSIYNALDGVNLQQEGTYTLYVGADGKNTYLRGNIAYPIYQCTVDDFNAKIDKIQGQYFDILDPENITGLPVLNAELTHVADIDVDTSAKIATQLNKVIDLVNQIGTDVLINYLKTAKR